MPGQQLDSVVVSADRIYWGGAFCFARSVAQRCARWQHKQQVRVAIYGAGEAGAQLAAVFAFGGQPQDRHLPRRQPGLLGSFDQRGCDPTASEMIEMEDSIDQVLLAIPSRPAASAVALSISFQRLGIPVLQVPSVDDLTSGRASIDALRPIAIEDLLGRDEVPPDPQLLGQAFAVRWSASPVLVARLQSFAVRSWL